MCYVDAYYDVTGGSISETYIYYNDLYAAIEEDLQYLYEHLKRLDKVKDRVRNRFSSKVHSMDGWRNIPIIRKILPCGRAIGIKRKRNKRR